MKSVIFPSKMPEALKPLTDTTPEFLIPVANKPIAEHLVECLVRHGIREIIMILNHLPYETELFFKAGERWGCRISYTLVKKKSPSVFSCLERIQNRLKTPFLAIPGNLITDLDIGKWRSTHEKREDAVSVTLSGPLTSEVDLFEKLIRMFENPIDQGFYPFIMSSEILSRILNELKSDNVESVLRKKREGDENFFHFSNFSCYSKVVDSYESYLKVNSDIIAGRVGDILIPGKRIKKGFWRGTRTKIHPTAVIEPPVLIGENCSINKGVTLHPGTVVGDYVMVDEGAGVSNSVILNRTYIGSHTEIETAIIQKNLMINVLRSLFVYVGDDFILGDMDRRLFHKMTERIINVSIAMVLLMISSPLFFLLYLYHLLFSSRKFFFKEKRFGSDTVVNLDGKRSPRSVFLYTFKSPYRWVRKLPWLLSVVKGEMNLVGNSPLTKVEVDSLTEEWQTQRFEAPIGIFHLWEVEGQSHPEWDEIIIAENYYAKTRTLGGDLKILLKAIFPFHKVIGKK